MDKVVEERAQRWLKGPFDEKTKEEIRRLLKEDPQGLEAAFFKELSFGTGGMRGVMGVGTNRMNIYTIRLATQGLATYMQKSGEKKLSAFIGYDVRHHSRLFAEEAARVLAGNGIEVFLTEEICPTPLASFGCRHFGCTAAIMITASHNPPQYNGYKVYWKDGGQLVAPHDVGVMEEVRKTLDWSLASLDSPLIRWVGREIDAAYFAAIKPLQIRPRKNSPLKIYYTNLHGTGIRLMPEALNLWGFEAPHLIAEQQNLDGAFPNAPSPNPEETATLQLGINQMLKGHGDLLLATDPDADRVGVAVRHQGQAIRLTGNQVAALLLQFICSSTLPKKAGVITTIVTTELFHAIALHFGLICRNVLTGFKYIAETMREWEEKKSPTFLFGAEESCGYLYGSYARDKDGIVASCLISELADLAKSQGKTLVDLLYELYRTYGIYREMQLSLSFSDTQEGIQQATSAMAKLRANPPAKIAGLQVTKIIDYKEGKTLPPSDVLELHLAGRTKLIVRPSGTEPKLKIYGEAFEPAQEPLEEAIRTCDLRLQHQMRCLEERFTTEAQR